MGPQAHAWASETLRSVSRGERAPRVLYQDKRFFTMQYFIPSFWNATCVYTATCLTATLIIRPSDSIGWTPYGRHSHDGESKASGYVSSGWLSPTRLHTTSVWAVPSGRRAAVWQWRVHRARRLASRERVTFLPGKGPFWVSHISAGRHLRLIETAGR